MITESKRILLIASIYSIILLPICYFPFTTDLSIFAMCGKTIANGGKLYIDAIDIKAPAIYYFFAFIHLITNSNEIGVRIFDFCWQLITALSISMLVMRTSSNRIASFTSGLLYSLSYTVLNFTSTTQVESFIALPLTLALNLYINKRNSTSSNIIIGILFGLIISLKITLGVLIFPIFLDIISNKALSLKHRFKSIITILVSLMFSFLFTLIPLLDKEVFTAYLIINKFLYVYISNPQFDMDLIKNFIKNTGNFWGDLYSITFSIFLIFGSYYFLKSKDKIQKLLGISILGIVFLLLSILIEKKLIPYHYSRIYLFNSIIGSFGLSYLIESIKNLNLKLNLINKIVISSMVIFLLIFSPIVRYTNLLKPMFYFYTDYNKYNSFFDTKTSQNCYRKSEYDVYLFLKANYNKTEKIDIISVGGNAIYTLLNNPKYSALLQSCFYYANFAPNEYKLMFRKDLEESVWLVIATKDEFHYNWHNRTSWQSLQNDTPNYQYVMNNFEMVKEVPAYKVFKRK